MRAHGEPRTPPPSCWSWPASCHRPGMARGSSDGASRQPSITSTPATRHARRRCWTRRSPRRALAVTAPASCFAWPPSAGSTCAASRDSRSKPCRRQGMTPQSERRSLSTWPGWGSTAVTSPSPQSTRAPPGDGHGGSPIPPSGPIRCPPSPWSSSCWAGRRRTSWPRPCSWRTWRCGRVPGARQPSSPRPEPVTDSSFYGRANWTPRGRFSTKSWPNTRGWDGMS